MKNVFLFPSIFLFVLLPLALQSQAHAQTIFAVGQKVEAGGGYSHKATVLQAKPPSYLLHYDDGSLPDGWEQGFSMRPRPSAIPTSSPRNGKYSIYVYSTNLRAMYDGYFVLNGGSYEVFLPGGKAGGSGQCSYSAAA